MRYTATYRFDGRGWVCQFEEPDIATFGRTIAAAKAHARSLLSVHLEVGDLPSAGVEIEDDVRLPAGVDVDVEALRRQRSDVDRLSRDIALSTRRAAATLRAAGLSTRDVGELLGISGARVAQLESDARQNLGEAIAPRPPRWTSDELYRKAMGER